MCIVAETTPEHEEITEEIIYDEDIQDEDALIDPDNDLIDEELDSKVSLFIFALTQKFLRVKPKIFSKIFSFLKAISGFKREFKSLKDTMKSGSFQGFKFFIIE